MGYARKDVEKTKKIAKKFVRYQEGAELYSIGLTAGNKQIIKKFARIGEASIYIQYWQTYVRFKSGYIPGESEIREAMDRAMILLPQGASENLSSCRILHSGTGSMCF